MVRYKARYLLCDIITPPDSYTKSSQSPYTIQVHKPISELSHKSILKAVRSSLAINLGAHGAGLCSNISVKYISPLTSTVIIRVSSDHFRMLWFALSMITELEGRGVIIRVKKVSGTIRKCEEFVKQGNKQIVEDLKGWAREEHLDNEMETD